MKTIIHFLIPVLLVLSATAETALDINKKHETAKAEALEAYLKANPLAKDKAMATSLLERAYLASDNEAKLLPFLETKYRETKKGADGDFREGFMAMYQLFNAALAKGDTEKAKALLATVEKDFAGHKEWSQAQRSFDSLKKKLTQPGVGSTMEISFTSLDGKKVDLAAMKGQVVLIDYWATWCGPCIAELPSVKGAYEKYHGKGFEIISISLDDDEQKLRNFIKEKQMSWIHQFDGKGWQNELSKKYGINSIPATFLIGKDGKVAATNLRGSALEEKLAELLP
jgi:thiol-disulfide isomerase/thioredoxin